MRHPQLWAVLKRAESSDLMLQLRLKRREVCDAPFAFPDELSDPYDLSRLWVFRFSPKK